MTEDLVQKILGFLCSKYHMTYSFAENKKYWGEDLYIGTYSFYNQFGCFTIANIPVIGEKNYYRLDSVDRVSDILNGEGGQLKVLTQDNQAADDLCYNRNVGVYTFETKIWTKHVITKGLLRIPFLWFTDKQELLALADVIEAQIKKYHSFFGIKV